MSDFTAEQLKQAQYLDEYYMAIAKLTNEFLIKYEDLAVRPVILGALFQHVVGLYRQLEDNPQLEHLIEGLYMTWDFQEQSDSSAKPRETH